MVQSYTWIITRGGNPQSTVFQHLALVQAEVCCFVLIQKKKKALQGKGVGGEELISQLLSPTFLVYRENSFLWSVWYIVIFKMILFFFFSTNLTNSGQRCITSTFFFLKSSIYSIMSSTWRYMPREMCMKVYQWMLKEVTTVLKSQWVTWLVRRKGTDDLKHPCKVNY